MIGIVIVTHGRLAEEFRSAMEHVVGRQPQLTSVCIGPDDAMEQRRKEILAAARSVDTGRGVVLLTDMFGGTPSNLAISILDEGNFEVIAGINLPMLVQLARVRSEMNLEDAVLCAKEAGQKYIRIASQMLGGK